MFKEFDKRLLNLNDNYKICDLINYLLLNLQDQTGKTIISKVELLYRSINKKQDSLKQISDFFNNSNDDVPLLEKYLITKRKLDKNHDYNKYYRTFRIKKPFKNYNYNEFKKICDEILLSNLSTYYVQYRRFIDNDIYKYLKIPLDYELINNSILSINSLLDNKDIDFKLNVSMYTEEFIDAIISNEIINEDSILSLSNIVNIKYNYHLLNKTIKKKWFDLFYKSNKVKEEENLNTFSKIKDEIYEEYINNYNIIKRLKEKLSFLKLILKEEKYNEIVMNIIKDGKPYENLIFYKKILDVAYQNKTASNIINSISPVKEIILKYCYDDLEEKKYINELISILPMLKCYLDIEEEEIKNISIINTYNEYDDIINNIYIENSKKNNLIPKSINRIWDNKLREAASILKENIDNISEDVLIKYFPCTISGLYSKNIEELIDKKLKFNKVIVISKDEYKIIDFESINKLCETVIYIGIDNDRREYDFYKGPNYLFKENDNILLEIKYFLLNKNIGLNIISHEFYMEINVGEYKIILLLNNNSVNVDVFLHKYYRDNNIRIYRIWYRDWWINKYNELDKINDYIKDLTINNN